MTAVMDDRTRLLGMIRTRRASIDAYVDRKTPASTRLSTISVVSSSIAAALTAGPGLGGGDFAQTVQEGLDLDRSDTVWRVLCLAAVAVSVTAAISANLSTTNDLAGRIAAAQQAGALLEKLQRRLEFPRPEGEDDVHEAVREYGDVVVTIWFVPEMRIDPATGQPDDGSEPERRRGGLAPSVAAAAVAFSALVLVVTLVGYGRGLI